MLLKCVITNFDNSNESFEFNMLPLIKTNTANIKYIKNIKINTKNYKILQRGILFNNPDYKSILTEAIKFAKQYIIKDIIDYTKLSDKETSFQFIFCFNNILYEYGFSLNQSKIFEEWLLKLSDNNQFEYLFTRNINSDPSIIINTNITNELKDLILNVFENNYIKNRKLLLHALNFIEIEDAKNIIKYFNDVHILTYKKCYKDFLRIVFYIIKNIINKENIYIVQQLYNDKFSKMIFFLFNKIILKIKSKNNQVIFTTNNLYLLNLNNLEKEEIWFVLNNSKNCLVPLSDFNIKDDQDLAKAYLCGRFG